MLCPTCNRPSDDPYRAHNGSGEIVQGCVDDCHTGHLPAGSDSEAWHNRVTSQQIRAAMVAHKLTLED